MNNELENVIFLVCQSTLTMHMFEGAPDSEATIPDARDAVNELRLALPDANIMFSSRLFNTNVIPNKILKEVSNLYVGDVLTETFKSGIGLTWFNENDLKTMHILWLCFFANRTGQDRSIVLHNLKAFHKTDIVGLMQQIREDTLT